MLQYGKCVLRLKSGISFTNTKTPLLVSGSISPPPTPAKNYQNDNFYTYNGIAIKGQTVILTKPISETSCEIFYYYKSNEYLLWCYLIGIHWWWACFVVQPRRFSASNISSRRSPRNWGFLTTNKYNHLPTIVGDRVSK